MLGRLVLLLLQIVGGWFGSNAAMAYIPFGEFRLFIFAVVAAIVVFFIGVIAAQVLKDVGTPSSSTLTWALLVGLLAAVLWTWAPSLPVLSDIPWGRVRAEYAVLAGAILGYMFKSRR
jgi:hypothetical protein